jgi:hypothetical protein
MLTSLTYLDAVPKAFHAIRFIPSLESRLSLAESLKTLCQISPDTLLHAVPETKLTTDRFFRYLTRCCADPQRMMPRVGTWLTHYAHAVCLVWRRDQDRYTRRGSQYNPDNIIHVRLRELVSTIVMYRLSRPQVVTDDDDLIKTLENVLEVGYTVPDDSGSHRYQSLLLDIADRLHMLDNRRWLDNRPSGQDIDDIIRNCRILIRRLQMYVMTPS